MSWTDTQANCILDVCCTDGNKKLKALSDVLHDDAGLDPHHAETTARFLIGLFDFAPKNSLYAFKQEIARLARTEDYEGS